MLNGRSYLGGPAGMNVGRMRDFHLSSLARSTVGDPRGYGVGPWGFAATPRAPLDGWPGTGHGAGGQGYWHLPGPVQVDRRRAPSSRRSSLSSGTCALSSS